MKNIVLTGMPGAGKSTIGVLLAKAMNYSFVDTDLILQQNAGCLLYELIEKKGIDYFMQYEDETLAGLNLDNTVIATGGSAVYGENGMNNLKKNGVVVYIRLSCEEIIRRVNNITTRGIVMKKGKTLQDVYKERTPLYEKYADVIIDGDNTTIEECIKKVYEAIV